MSATKTKTFNQFNETKPPHAIVETDPNQSSFTSFTLPGKTRRQILTGSVLETVPNQSCPLCSFIDF